MRANLNDCLIGRIYWLNINSGDLYEWFDPLYKNSQIRVVVKSVNVWIDNTNSVKKYLEIVKD